ncbi:MAG: DUF2341 domain-containing protein [Kiritimatiellae bacterium]|nr:DUF2341 domain-containing protein [Kiritimatiellia bacterium]
MAAQPAAYGGWLGGYAYRQKVTVSSSLAQGTSDLTNFPLLVSLTDQTFRHTFYGGNVATRAGYDIAFSAADGSTPLDSEVESYTGTASNGWLCGWVRIPVLTNGAAHTVYVYYGSPAAASEPGNPAGVWDANYMGVWHLDEITGDHADSTANGNTGTVGGAPIQDIDGRIGVADDFDAANDYVQATANATLNVYGKSQMTVEAWVRPEGVGENSYGRIVSKVASTGDSDIGYDFHVREIAAAGVLVKVHVDQATTAAYRKSADYLLTNLWHHVAFTYNEDGDNAIKLYFNGALTTGGTDTAGAGAITDDGAYNLRIGNQSDVRTFDGQIDEVRISDIARTADWIATCHTNQAAPGDFLTFGAVERRGTMVLIK